MQKVGSLPERGFSWGTRELAAKQGSTVIDDKRKAG